MNLRRYAPSGSPSPEFATRLPQNSRLDSTEIRKPEEEPEWRKNEYNPRIKKVGEIKQALVLQEEHLQYAEDEIGSTAIVPVRYFADESEATAWLDSSEQE